MTKVELNGFVMQSAELPPTTTRRSSKYRPLIEQFIESGDPTFEVSEMPEGITIATALYGFRNAANKVGGVKVSKRQVLNKSTGVFEDTLYLIREDA